MTHTRLIALACAACCTAAYAGPFDAFKGKMKEGLYEYKMEMDMSQVPNMPPGMKNHTTTFQKCITHDDIDKGSFGKGGDRPGAPAKAPENCDVSDMKVSGNNASYKMTCKDKEGKPHMTADNNITFASDGWKMDMKMSMNQGGRMINMNQKMEGRYIGACDGKK
jgi:uncharacterized protein DUF3617